MHALAGPFLTLRAVLCEGLFIRRRSVCCIIKTLVLCRCPSVSPVTGAKPGNKTAALIFPSAHASEGMEGWTKQSRYILAFISRSLFISWQFLLPWPLFP